jgi:hypothetical protein
MGKSMEKRVQLPAVDIPEGCEHIVINFLKESGSPGWFDILEQLQLEPKDLMEVVHGN